MKTLARKDEDVQACAADVIELCKIDDEAAVARFYLAENFFLERLRSGRVQFSREAESNNLRRSALANSIG